MISKTMETAYNDHIAVEFYSAHLYLAMSAYLESIDLPGFANWMRIQYEEEVFHAKKFFEYVIERDGRAVLKGFDAPPLDFGTPVEVFAEVYKHEQLVTSYINVLVDKALSEKDHASHTFLQWFVNEQVEEEATAKGLLQQLKMIGDSKAALYQIDRELAQRTFALPPTSKSGE